MKQITCPQCGSPNSPAEIRCIRCNAILFTPCRGSCASCQRKDTCK